ncbi:MAG: hypothetical protein OHK0046_27000 [Anaerolineae bacterium]
MMKRLPVCVLLLLGLVGISTATAAQGECRALLQASIIGASLECGALEDGQVCYGNAPVSTEPTALDFPGATLDAAEVETLRTDEMGIDTGEWGIALVQQPDVFMVMFGAATLENLGAGTVSIPFRVTNRTGSFARSAPNTDSEVLAPLSAGETISANGRLADSTWLRIALPQAQVGWVSAEVISGDVDALPVVDPEETPERLYAPMTAFNLRSGIGDSPCPSAPESGLLLQTPEDSETRLIINAYTLDLSGTAFIQARSDSDLVVYVLEGEAALQTLDADASASTAVRATSGSGLIAGDQVSAAPYDYTRVEMLPIELLPRPILIDVEWERALIPAQPNPLAGLTSEAVCTIAVGEDVNVRSGPGRDYPLRGSLLTNQSARPDGRAAGTDGRVWWRITPGAWVSFDVVFAVGNCNALPLIDALPRLQISPES